MQRDPGSFRDPAGYVVLAKDTVYRFVMKAGADDWHSVLTSQTFQRLQAEGLLLPTWRADPLEINEFRERSPHCNHLVQDVIAQKPLDLVTYPYEWPFEMLRAAALLHLELHLRAMEGELTLKDASAYNVQFDGAAPCFIDILSIRPYSLGEYWLAHDQFVRQFLAPLLLESYTAVPYQPLLRSNLEGIDPAQVAAMMPLRTRFDYRIWLHLFLPARFAREGSVHTAQNRKPARPLPRIAFISMLQQLKSVVTRLRPPNRTTTAWSGYSADNSYADDSEREKRSLVAHFVERRQPKRLIDLGCNDGVYSRLALQSGAKRVFSLDIDLAALDRLYLDARRQKLAITPLVQDFANPSPSQGWNGEERKGLVDRLRGDAALALAFIHHLVIGRNVPLDQVVELLFSIAPECLVEFVPPEDPMVKIMMGQRRDGFHPYSFHDFVAAVERAGGAVIATTQLSSSARCLVHIGRS